MEMNYVEEVKNNGQIIAIIIRTEFNKDGVVFFTPGDFSQQLGYMKHKKGERIQEHLHELQIRKIKYTQEILFIKKGRVRVNFYSEDKSYFTNRELKKGDVILLASGGHGFEFLEETEMIEVKQGPYSGDRDKVRFEGRNHGKIL
jgi:mannose-6-phosphate isomerase-like protein (cupin superfamily)